MGTDGGGLLRITPRPWKMITRRKGLGIDAVHSVCQDQQGRIWFAGGTAQPYWLNRGVVSAAIQSPQSNVLDPVWAVLPALDGAMWIGTYRGTVFQYRDGVLTGYGEDEGLSVGPVRALMEDRQNALWVGGGRGLSRITGSQVVPFSQSDGLSSERISALAEDSQGRIYIGTVGGGLQSVRSGAVHRLHLHAGAAE
jgi:ligand-binding sensor domain-containing protein